MADSRHFKVILEWDKDDSVWVTYVPALNFLSTFGETRETALEQTKDAIEGYLETARSEGVAIPQRESEVIEIEVALA